MGRGENERRKKTEKKPREEGWGQAGGFGWRTAIGPHAEGKEPLRDVYKTQEIVDLGKGTSGGEKKTSQTAKKTARGRGGTRENDVQKETKKETPEKKASGITFKKLEKG